MEKAATESSKWRSGIALGHTIARLTCSITGLSIALVLDMQDLIQNQQNAFAQMFFVVIALFSFVIVDYRNLQE
jgi:hypothetical protein